MTTTNLLNPVDLNCFTERLRLRRVVVQACAWLCTIGLAALLQIGAVAQNKVAPVPIGIRPGPFGQIGLGLNLHSADFSRFPGVPNCCPRFTGGTGVSPVLGIGYDFMVAKKWWLTPLVTFSGLGGSLSSTETQPVYDPVFDLPVDGTIEHTIRAFLPAISMSLLVGFNPASRFRLNAGLGFSVLRSPTFEQSEEIISPNFVVFKENLSTTRNPQQGAIPGANSFLPALVLGASHELPLNKKGTLLLQPAFAVSLPLQANASQLSWRTNTLLFSVGLKFGGEMLGTAPATPRAPDSSDVLRPPSVVESGPTGPRNVVATQKANATEKSSANSPEVKILFEGVFPDGRTQDVDAIVVEQLEIRELHPMLSYVFFDLDKADVPERYKVLSKESSSTFTPENLRGRDGTLSLYWHVLNIVGSRMKKHPNAKLVLTGCSDGSGANENQSLGLQRARKVAQYLTQTWGVSPKRIEVTGRGLPSKPSKSSDQDVAAANAENRRVELSSNQPEILAPLTMTDVVTTVVPPKVRVRPQHADSLAFEEWQIGLVGTKGRTYAKVSGTGKPDSKEWSLTTNPLDLPDSLSAYLEAETTDNSLSATSVSLPVKKKLRTKDRPAGGGDSVKIERYSLILFDFNQADPGPANRSIVDYIRNRSRSATSIQIDGFTDRLGDEVYNRTLSQQRAQKLADMLGVADVIVNGFGEQELHQGNLPEGRFYSRTVRVTLTLP